MQHNFYAKKLQKKTLFKTLKFMTAYIWQEYIKMKKDKYQQISMKVSIIDFFFFFFLHLNPHQS